MQHCKLLTPFQVFAAILAIQECSQSTESRLQSNYCIKFQIFAILLLCKFAHCNYSTSVWKFSTEHSQNSPIVCQNILITIFCSILFFLRQKIFVNLISIFLHQKILVNVHEYSLFSFENICHAAVTVGE